MARELQITITVENAQAKRKLAATDAALNKTTNNTKDLGKAQTDQELAGRKADATMLALKASALVAATALIAATKASLEYASSLDKMKAATDISFRGLQQLENIAVGSNTSLHNLTSAVLDLQRRLATGDDSAVGALRQLGIKLQDFLALKGDQQFLVLARALGSMTNEVERNKVAYQLFRRSYKETLSALTSDVDKLKDAVHLNSEQQLADLARVEQRWAQFKLSVKRHVVDLIATLQSSPRNWLDSIDPGQLFHGRGSWSDNRPDLPTAPGLTLPSPIGMPEIPSEGQQRRITDAAEANLKRLTKAHDEAALAASKNQRATIDYWTTYYETFLSPQAPLSANQIRGHAGGNQVLGMQGLPAGTLPSIQYGQHLGIRAPNAPQSDDLRRTELQVRRLSETFIQLGQVAGGAIGQILSDTGQMIIWLERAQDTAKKTGGEFGVLSELFAKGATNTQRFTTAATAAVAVLQGLQNVSRQTSFAGGAMAGAQAGAPFGPWGMAFGAIAGGIYGSIQGQRQQEEAHRQMEINRQNAAAALRNDLEQQRRAFERTFGDLRELEVRAERAGIALTRYLNADSVNQLTDAMQELLDTFDFQEKAFERLNEAIERYGFTIDELGPALQAQRLGEQAKLIYEDWMLLVNAGINVEDVARRMAGAINEFLELSIRTGTEVPLELKPIIDALSRMGLLTVDLKDIKFADSLSQQFKRVEDAINRMIMALLTFLGISTGKGTRWDEVLTGLPKKIGELENAIPAEMHTGGVVLPFLPRAHRGLAIDEVPIIAQTGEGVLNRGAMRRLGGARGLNQLNAGGGLGTTVVLQPGAVVVHSVIEDSLERRRIAEAIMQDVEEELELRQRRSA